MTAPNHIHEDVGVQANMLRIKILTISGKISSDHTGQLPVTSRRGGKYIMFMADYESDTILVELLISCARIDLIRAVTKLYEHLKERGLQPHLHMIHNECSTLMKKFIIEAGETHQLVPLGLHRALIA